MFNTAPNKEKTLTVSAKTLTVFGKTLTVFPPPQANGRAGEGSVEVG